MKLLKDILYVKKKKCNLKLSYNNIIKQFFVNVIAILLSLAWIDPLRSIIV